MSNNLFGINWRYTIGEILIVILGISIAFGLNNWASDRKDQSLKIKYLENLKEDLIADSLQLHKNIDALNHRINISKTISAAFQNRSTRLDTVLKYIYQIPLPIDFRPRDIGYQSMINSGDLRLIDDFELKKQIQEHYLNNEHVKEIYERQNIIVDKYLGNFFIEKMDYPALYSGDFSSLNDLGFINSIRAMSGTFILKVEASKEGIQSARALIEQLDQILD